LFGGDMKRILILGLMAVAAASQALLVADNGTNVGTGDDNSYNVTLGGTFQFYGSNITSIGMTTNGYLTTTANPFNYASSWPITGDGEIAPFMDDLYSVNAGYYNDHGSTGTYDQFTWNAQHYPGSGNILMQAVLFRSATTISGFNFQAGDIAFSYDAVSELNGSTFNGNVGLNDGTGSFITAPGCGGSQNTFGSALPIFPQTGQFFLFRWDSGRQTYNASLQGVPEPASMAILGMGALALLRRRRKNA
jgi:hypothetical protein